MASFGTQNGIVLNKGKVMQKQNEVAFFPELFDDMDQFFDEQETHLKQVAGIGMLVLAGASLILAYLLL